MWADTQGAGGAANPTTRVVVCTLVVLWLAVACTGGGTAEDGTASEGAPQGTAGRSEPAGVGGAPEIPRPTEPDRPTPGPAGDAEDPAAMLGMTTEPPVPGETVLVHLEGPLSSREATDVVIRTEEGEEVERYRLPGAIGVWAAPGSSTALLYTLPGGWARYDAVAGQLALVTFPGEVPGPTIQPGSGIAGPAALWDPLDTSWLLRMDSGAVTDLTPITGDGRLEAMSRGGRHAIVRTPDDALVLLRTRDAQPRTLSARTAAISEDGLRVAMVDHGGQVVVEDVDGEGRRVLGPAPDDATALPLPDGRVLLTGAAPAVIGQPGEPAPVPRPTPQSAEAPTAQPDPVGDDEAAQAAGPTPTPTSPASVPLAPSVPISPPARVSADGRMALATTTGGLALVDLEAGTAVPLPSTEGFTPIALGPSTVLWATTTDPHAPGLLVVDPVTGVVTRLLKDLSTGSVVSVTADGRRVTLHVGTAPGEGATTVVVDADGTITDMGTPAERVEAILHPAGELVAATTLRDADRALQVGPLEGPRRDIPTGRNPVWLSRVGG